MLCWKESPVTCFAMITLNFMFHYKEPSHAYKLDISAFLSGILSVKMNNF